MIDRTVLARETREQLVRIFEGMILPDIPQKINGQIGKEWMIKLALPWQKIFTRGVHLLIAQIASENRLMAA